MDNVENLFLSCPFACIIWRIVYFSYNIPPPTNITNMFNNWLNEVNKKDAWCFSFVLINMDVFDKQNATKKLQVIF
jgi:fructose-specific phosphotransferase system IIC component